MPLDMHLTGSDPLTHRQQCARAWDTTHLLRLAERLQRGQAAKHHGALGGHGGQQRRVGRVGAQRGGAVVRSVKRGRQGARQALHAGA